MIGMFRGLIDRAKALFITTVALDFEAQFVANQAERKADLLRQAAVYEREGLKSVAQDLRTQAEGISTQRPLATLLPAIEHLQNPQDVPLLANEETIARPAPTARKKGGRS